MTQAVAPVDTRMNVQSVRPFRHTVRSCLDQVAAATGLLTWCERRMRQGLTILMYHRVLPAAQCQGYPLASLVMPAEVFEAQVRWLAANCRVLPVREAMTELERGGPFDRPLVALTFDDGYHDNAEIVQPILERCDVRGTFYITTGFVEHGEPLWFDRAASAWERLSTDDRRALLDQVRARLDEHHGKNGDGAGDSAPDAAITTWMDTLKRVTPTDRTAILQQAEARALGEVNRNDYRPMTIDQVKSLSDAGHEIASHTVTHPILPMTEDDDLRYELERSREQLAAWIGSDVTGFCYPNGDTNARVERAVQAAGYTHACTTVSGLNKPGVASLRLSRLPITMQRTVRGMNEHDDLAFRAEVSRLRELWRSR